MKPDIVIKQYEGGTFDVHLGDKFAYAAGFDEMLGLVASIAMPEPRPCLHWLKTQEEHDAWFESLKPGGKELEVKTDLPPREAV